MDLYTLFGQRMKLCPVRQNIPIWEIHVTTSPSLPLIYHHCEGHGFDPVFKPPISHWLLLLHLLEICCACLVRIVEAYLLSGCTSQDDDGICSGCGLILLVVV